MRTTAYTPDLRPPKNIIAFIGAMVLLFACWQLWDDYQLSTHGRRTNVEGIAVTKHTKAALAVLGLDRFWWASWYTAHLRFETDAGPVVITGDVSMPDADVVRLENHEPIYIDYLPEKPSTVRFSDSTHTGWAVLVLAACFFALHFWSLRKSAKR